MTGVLTRNARFEYLVEIPSFGLVFAYRNTTTIITYLRILLGHTQGRPEG